MDSRTIAAIATGEGGAIAVIRVSGQRAIDICESVFRPVSGKKLSSQKGFTIHYGDITNGEEVIDDVLVTLFRAPRSYTGEDMVEISCHSSSYIKQQILTLLFKAGAESAQPGEFTLKAFLNNKLDLSQAEAVADIIASDSREAHTLAVNQIRGGYSKEFTILRDRLLELTSLLELELDFSEEDVEFADRTKLREVLNSIKIRIAELKESFALGNVIKNGIPVAIIGSPNVGKSTLLNALLREERAIVSDIAGTTRDVIEDTININGITFRFIDTAGIRQTDDVLEKIGIERTISRMESAKIILLVCDASEGIEKIVAQHHSLSLNNEQKVLVVINKIDKVPTFDTEAFDFPTFTISALKNEGIEQLTNYLYSICGAAQKPDVIVSNIRHYEALCRSYEALLRAQEGLVSSLPTDLLSEDIRSILHHIGIITGEITTDDILGSIFSKFCIGK